jgi:hypothetical protein
MKRLSSRRMKWLRKRAANQLRRRSGASIIASYQSEAGEQKVTAGRSKSLPAKLCLHTSLEDSVSFFHRFRLDTKFPKAHYSRTPTSKKRGRLKQLRNFYDFVPLTNVTPGAALILAAEFDRLNSSVNRKPTTIDVEKWDEHVYGMLFHLGFFKLLGFSEGRIKRQALTRPPMLADLKIMPMVSGTLADLTMAAEEIKSLFSTVDANKDLEVKLFSALIDAIENVVNHAYDGLSINDRKLIPRRWWISGAASNLERSITVSIFDQGISIPVSLPIKWNKDKLFASVLSKFGPGPWRDGQDGEAVRAAMFLSNTSTGISSRGKGLHKIKEIMSELNGGSLLILSRKGCYKWENQQESCFTMESSLLGTYVELKANF